MNTAIGAEFRGVEGAGATETGEQREKARGCGCSTCNALGRTPCQQPEQCEAWIERKTQEREVRAYLAADKNEQEDK